MSGVPNGWSECELENVVEVLDSWRIPLNSNERLLRISGKKPEELVPYYGATGQVGLVDDFIFDEPLILLGEDGVPFFDLLKAKAYSVSGKTWVNNHAHVLRPIAAVSHGKYVEHFLNSFDYKGYVAGTTRLKLTQGSMNKIPVRLAPFAEQKRIADKLDGVLARVDACRDRLDRIPTLLKRFRQSVLAAATSGRLTEDWRKSVPSSEWQASSIGNITCAIFDGPFGSNLKSDDYTNHGVRVVRLENIGHLSFDASKETYVSNEKYHSLAKHTLQPDDILFSSFVDEEVRVCLLPGDLPTAAINKADCFCLRVDAGQCLPIYLAYRLACKTTYLELKERVHGATRPRINLKQLKQYSVDLPSLPEQTEIVRRVDLLFAFADRLEARLVSARQQVGQLTPALLSKAFRGELVAQDPADEPASALLQRLASQRAAAPKGRRGRSAGVA